MEGGPAKKQRVAPADPSATEVTKNNKSSKLHSGNNITSSLSGKGSIGYIIFHFNLIFQASPDLIMAL